MKVYFNNDGSYDQAAVNIPVLFNGNPIGFISEVDQERVICYIWERFISREQIGLNLTGPQDIRSISINTNFQTVPVSISYNQR